MNIKTITYIVNYDYSSELLKKLETNVYRKLCYDLGIPYKNNDSIHKSKQSSALKIHELFAKQIVQYCTYLLANQSELVFKAENTCGGSYVLGQQIDFGVMNMLYKINTAKTFMKDIKANTSI